MLVIVSLPASLIVPLLVNEVPPADERLYVARSRVPPELIATVPERNPLAIPIFNVPNETLVLPV